WRVPVRLPRRGLFVLRVHQVDWVGHSHQVQRVVPLVVELVAADPVLAVAHAGAHLRAAWVAPSLMGTALARSTFLSNFPTEVLGTSSMNRTSSGSHHLATLSLRKSITSCSVTWPLNSGLATA